MLLCLSASHKTAGFDLLEQLSTTPATIAGELVDDRVGVDGAVVLATCNRFEAYLDVEEAGSVSITAAVDRVVALVSGSTGVDGERIRSGLDVLRGEAAARHLFAVSSGLESVVVGESEISGQVRRALESARTNGTTSAGLERVFQQASTTSREVRTTTSIGGAGRSIVRLALQLVESRITDWRDLDVVLIGTGRYAGATLAALRDRGVARVSVHSPSGRAARFASREGVSAVPDGGLRDAVAGASLVIACSTAATYLLEPSHFAGADGSRMVVDLGLPRNVDPDVAGVEGVELLDLETISLHAPLRELRAADDAEELVGSALGEYRAAEQEALVTPAIVAYRDHVFGVLEGELSRLRGRGAATEETERALRHLVSVLVHTPSTRARALARQGEADRFVDGIEALFGVAPQAGTQAASAPLSCPVQHGSAS